MNRAKVWEKYEIVRSIDLRRAESAGRVPSPSVSGSDAVKKLSANAILLAACFVSIRSHSMEFSAPVLQANANERGMRLSWSKIKGADTYNVYGWNDGRWIGEVVSVVDTSTDLTRTIGGRLVPL